MLFHSGKGRKKRGKGGRGRRARLEERTFTCVCPACGHELPHQTGRPCFETRCPRCDSTMARRFAMETQPKTP